jgi:hypothetical protein
MSGDSSPANVLFEWYERYIGSPEDETDVYVGFALFFGGIALGVLGVVLFLWSATVSEASFEYVLREIAAASGATGLPVLLLGVTVLLPVRRRSMYAALVGTVVCLGGIGLFVSAYPANWNVAAARDMSAEVVALYTVGLVAVVASTGSSLVGHRVERATVASTAADEEEDDEGVTTEQVRQDIDAAMAEANLSWGGVEKTETKRLSLNTDGIDEVESNVDTASATTTRASGNDVDDAVAGLRQLQGEGAKQETASSGGVDEQTAALKELKAQQRRENEQSSDGAVERVRAWLTGLRGD